MTPKYQLETLYQIFDNTTGEKVTVGHDSDALGLVEIRVYDSFGKNYRSIILFREQAALVAEALTKHLETTNTDKE